MNIAINNHVVKMKTLSNAIAIARSYAEDHKAVKQSGFYVFHGEHRNQVSAVEYYDEDLDQWFCVDTKMRQAVDEEIANEGTKILHFNTGRSYTSQGQRIIATQKGKWVAFNDLDRGIYGVLEYDGTVPFSQKFVMVKYDNSRYDWLPDDPEAAELLSRTRQIQWEELASTH